MTRVKKAVNALKTRKNVLRKVKGYRFGRGSKERMAQEAIFHAGSYAFAHRRDKKNDFRKLWNVKINAGLSSTSLGTSGKMPYSKFIATLKKKNIALDRKILAGLAEFSPETFKRVLTQVK
ncbi:MAG: 50S ribosomal protein L20 [bacterium]|nr:50S ribosomal protein L20 [bacterium]